MHIVCMYVYMYVYVHVEVNFYFSSSYLRHFKMEVSLDLLFISNCIAYILSWKLNTI